MLVVLSLVWAGCGDSDPIPIAVAPVATPTTTTPATTAEAALTGDLATNTAATAAFPPVDNPPTLSDWNQLAIESGVLTLGDGVTAYSLNSALFSDYAHKLRTIWLPDGSDGAIYHAEDVFDFPVGTVITKTFYYPIDSSDPDRTRVLKVTDTSNDAITPLDLSTVRLVETRVLVHRPDGWAALPYVWNDDQTEATLERVGDLQTLTLVDVQTETAFPYVVPNVNQCAGCHVTNLTSGVMTPIGPKARHLNRMVDLGDGEVDQLASWRTTGLLRDAPDPSEIPSATVWGDESASLDARARAYLDINCAHCHNRVGPADTSGLFLEISTELGPRLGVCKSPIAAGEGTGGRFVGILPGAPDESIFVYRMQTEDPGAMMPEVGRSVIHAEGVELISAWIESLSGAC